MSEQRIRKQMVFRGQVQGVGFRYRAFYTASSLGLTGFVKNEWDGSVLMEVQGEEASIQRMLSQLISSDFIVVQDMETKEMPLAVESSFRIG